MPEVAISERWECREGGSKAYELYLRPSGKGWVVDFAFGKIGGTLKNATKTPTPVTYAEALKVLDACRKERTGKQYTCTTGTVPHAQAPVQAVGDNSKVDTGLRVQLLNEIELPARKKGESLFDYYYRAAYTYLNSAEWVAQRKHNGERNPIIWENGILTGANRKGEARAIAANVAAALQTSLTKRKISGLTKLDGEMVSTTYWVFDLLAFNGNDWSHRIFTDRAMHLKRLIDDGTDIRFVEVAETPAQKVKMLRDLLAEFKDHEGDTFCAAEGMVFKKRNSTVKPGRPNSGGDQMKLKFWRDVDVYIKAIKPGKRSALMALLDEHGHWVEMGYCTIPANYPIPTPGEVAKVRFLYVLKGGSLVQPQFEGVRTDKDASECTINQLVYYPGSAGEAE